MKEIGQYISSPSRPQVTAKSQWSDLVGRFTHQYNLRATRKITLKRMAMLLSTIKTMEGLPYLEYFFNECMKADNFGRYFNWKISTKKK